MIRKLTKWLDYGLARLRSRRHAHQLLTARPVRRVLVVCYGNIYRSPFAAAYLQAFGGDALEVRSAGFHSSEGRSVKPSFIEIARQLRVDLSKHHSRLVQRDDLNWADIVLIMDGHNYRMMHYHYPDCLTKTLWLGAVSPDTPILIDDPYNSSPEQQWRIARQLDAACESLLYKLKANATTP